MFRANTITYWLAWTLSRGLFRGIYRGEYFGQHNIPKDGSFILAGNHESFFDPPMFGSGVSREIAYFARKTLFKPGFPEKLLTELNSIPVDRDGASDIAAFKKVFGVLKKNQGILLFPEGTRSSDGKLQEAKKGIGLIACKAQVPVVPARISGSFKAYNRSMKVPDFKPVINIMYGPPIYPEDYDPGKEDEDRYMTASRKIMQGVENLAVPDSIGKV